MTIRSGHGMSTAQRTSLALVGLGAVAAVGLMSGRSDAPAPPEAPRVQSVDPDFAARHEATRMWGDVLQLQGACLDARLNHNDPQAAPCLELARRRAAAEAAAETTNGSPAGATPPPVPPRPQPEAPPSHQAQGASQ